MTEFDVEKAFEVNLIEDRKKRVGVNGNQLSLNFKPFEIKSLALRF